MEDKRQNGFIEILKRNWIWAALAGVFVFIILPAILFAGYGTIKNPGFCALCHETHYDDKEYAVKNIKSIKMPRGVLVGCAECHPSPFIEYKRSGHYTTENKNKPGCANCHRPHSVREFSGYMYLAHSPWEGVMESLVKDMEKWEGEMRPLLAKKARESFLREDSKSCSECHIKAGVGFDGDLEPHKIMAKEKMTCIECHFNLVHKEVPWPEMEAKKKRLRID